MLKGKDISFLGGVPSGFQFIIAFFNSLNIIHMVLTFSSLGCVNSLLSIYNFHQLGKFSTDTSSNTLFWLLTSKDSNCMYFNNISYEKTPDSRYTSPSSFSPVLPLNSCLQFPVPLCSNILIVFVLESILLISTYIFQFSVVNLTYGSMI